MGVEKSVNRNNYQRPSAEAGKAGMASENVLVVHSRILRDNYWKRLLQWGDG